MDPICKEDALSLADISPTPKEIETKEVFSLGDSVHQILLLGLSMSLSVVSFGSGFDM